MALFEGQERVHIAAPAEKLYAMVSDVSRMGEWSPECYRCEWVDGSEAKVGARFKGHNKRGWMKWSNSPRVTAAEPGREFAFLTYHGSKEATQWRYTFTPSGDGTDVTESYQVLDYPWYLRILNPAPKRAQEVQAGMRTSLDRLKAAAEAD